MISYKTFYQTLRNLTIKDIQNYRIWLLSSQDENGSGDSQAYDRLIFGMFRKAPDYAVKMGGLENNISKKAKAIPKGKAIVPYWTKIEFERVISQICIDDFYEHLNFVML